MITPTSYMPCVGDPPAYPPANRTHASYFPPVGEPPPGWQDKPVLSPAAVRLYNNIIAYARRHTREPEGLAQAARYFLANAHISRLSSAVRELIHKGLLEDVAFSPTMTWVLLSQRACYSILYWGERNKGLPPAA
jgi:hypothetical protein